MAQSNINDSQTAGKSAFDWDVYKNRKTALQYLKQNCTLVDTILETDDGSAFEFVHSQVISAFGDKLNDFINQNGILVDRQPYWSRCQPGKMKLVRLPKLNKYTLSVLVDCAYTGCIKTDLQSGGIWQVLKVADHYEMTDVIRACCAFLMKNLNSSNCVQFYHVGIEHKHALQRSAWCNIRSNFKHILAQNLKSQQQRDEQEISAMLDDWQSSAAGARATLAQVNPRRNNPSLPQNHHQQRQTVDSNSLLRRQQVEQINGESIVESGSNDDSHLATTDSQQLQQQQPHSPSLSLSTSTINNSNGSSDNHLYNNVDDIGCELLREEIERKNNNLATIKYEHFGPLLMSDKLNIDHEESVWDAIRLWCNYNLNERASKVTNLLPCMRFPRFRTGTEFSTRRIWRDPLVLNNKQAQHQLAVLDRNHRDYLTGPNYLTARDGFLLPCAPQPRQLRPRIPHSILLAIGGWQQGQPTTLIESYDINCNLWFECKKRIMSPLAYHGIEFINGLLYICGGTDGTEILNEVFTYDPVGGECAQRSSMRENRCYVSTASLESYLYAMGGHNGVQRMKSVERFDLTNETWTHVQDMNVARSDASACVHESMIYIAGGLNDQVIESSVEFYNHLDNTWTFITSMITPRTSFTLLLYNDHLLAIGGNNGNERLASVEQYSFETKLWTQHSQMRHRRSTFSAALVDESKLIVVGGYNGQTPFSQVEMYDQMMRQWIMLHKIRFDRSGLKVVAVNDLPNATDYTFHGSALASAALGTTPAQDAN